MAYKLSKRSIERLKGVDPLLVVIAADALNNAPYDFAIADKGGYRTAAEQRQLFDDKKSKCDGTIKKSKHQTGKAIDIVCYKDGEITWSADIFTKVAEHIIHTAAIHYNVKLTWGGTWRMRDLPHFEL